MLSSIGQYRNILAREKTLRKYQKTAQTQGYRDWSDKSTADQKKAADIKKARGQRKLKFPLKFQSDQEVTAVKIMQPSKRDNTPQIAKGQAGCAVESRNCGMQVMFAWRAGGKDHRRFVQLASLRFSKDLDDSCYL